MAGYIDNLIVEDIMVNNIITGSNCDDLDLPLLNTATDTSNDLCKHPCRYNQAGFGASKHDRNVKEAKFKIAIATVLCFVFMITEFLGGYLAGSLAIMTDAAHLTSDCVSFLIGLAAIHMSKKKPDQKMSFGYKRIEVLGAILSILGIWFLTALLFYLAIERIFTNEFEIDANTMMIVSGIGIVINIIMAFVLHGEFGSHTHSHSHSHSHSTKKSCHTAMENQHNNNEFIQIPTFVIKGDANGEIRSREGSITAYSIGRNDENIRRTDLSNEVPFTGITNNRSHHLPEPDDIEKNLNLRAAVIHVIGDLIQSIGVFIAAIVIKFIPDAKLADPLCTLLFSVIVMLTTVKIMKESILIIMDAVPSSVSLKKIEKDLCSIDGVKSIHNLNVWSQSSNLNIVMAHFNIDELADSNLVLQTAVGLVRNKYKIKHSTFQIERNVYES